MDITVKKIIPDYIIPVEIIFEETVWLNFVNHPLNYHVKC